MGIPFDQRMLGAFLTTIFFSLSALFAQRSLRLVGATRANLGRLLVAFIFLGAYAHTLGGGLHGTARNWFVASGAIGMGVGDLAQFMALPRLGARLTVLMTQCLAAPIAMLVEWLWLGTTLRPDQLAWSFFVLLGILIALLPSRAHPHPPRVPIRPIGFLAGFLSAAGQGVGAVLSRKASSLAVLAGTPVDGMTAAYQRIVGGMALTLTFFAVRRMFLRPTSEAADAAPVTRRAVMWISANAFCGAIIGVSCYQWALATTPSGLVLPIVATTPLVIVPLAYWVEGERPARRSVAGGMVAVAGAIALALSATAARD